MERMERDVDNVTDTSTWQVSPLAAVQEPLTQPSALSEGPVKFLLVSGSLDDGSWGLVGAYWLSIDAERGGFIGSPDGIWTGSEMVRSFRSALGREWSAEQVYTYWRKQVGMAGKVMIDPQQHADTLFHVARRVGAL
jgi:hypothetical protein